MIAANPDQGSGVANIEEKFADGWRSSKRLIAKQFLNFSDLKIGCAIRERDPSAVIVVNGNFDATQKRPTSYVSLSTRLFRNTKKKRCVRIVRYTQQWI